MTKKTSLAFILFILSIPVTLSAQGTGTGLPSFGSLSSFGFDTVNNQNLNVYFSIPLISSLGRGLPLNLTLTNNSMLWQPGGAWSPVVDAGGNPTWGWVDGMPVGGYIGYHTSTISPKCYPGGYITPITIYSGFAYIDALGTAHPASAINYRESDCPNQNYGTYHAYADDHSGYYIDGFGFAVKSPRGEGIRSSTAVDANGNYITKTVVSSTETDFTDSVGNNALKILYTPNSTNPTQIQYEFLDGTGSSNYKTITLLLNSTNIKTNFGCSNPGIVEYTGTANLPTELDIPTPSGTLLKYLFAYEPTPQNSGYYTGRIAKVTLPTGGYYAYTYPGTHDSINCSDGTTTSVNRTVSDGTNTATWNFVRNVANFTTTLTTPQLADTANANDTVFTFNSLGGETSRKIYANSPGTTLLRTISTTWVGGTPTLQTTALEDASTTSATGTTYDSNGLLDEIDEYDWGTGGLGSLLRKTTLTYNISTNYTSRNLINLLTTKIIKDGSGTIQYRQDVTYDGTALGNCPTGVPQHDDTDYPCSMLYRGNPTSVTTYLSPSVPSNPITYNSTYDVFGNLLTAQPHSCQTETLNYSTATKYSEPDSIVCGSSPQLTSSFTYNSYTGKMLTSKDPNNQTTTYYYDFLRRPTSVVRPDNSTVSYGYNDASFTATTTTPIDSSRSLQLITGLDTLGRPVTAKTEDANNNTYSVVSTKFNLAGRAYGTSNPYTGSPSNWTTTSFDALSRPYQVKLQDNSLLGYSYTTNTVTATDQAGKARKSVFDGAGRLAKLFEPDVTNGNSLTVETDYSYTVLNSPSTVTQGVQTRTNIYDALGRLSSVTTPEAGTTCFGTYLGSTCQKNGYDNFGNLISRTDVRGVVTNYTYDSLSRLIGISYGQPLPSGVSAMPNTICNPGSGSANSNVCFYYDQGGAPAYALGRRTKRVDASGSETYTYNNLGEMTELQKVIGSNTYPIQYAYNTAGELLQSTYPSLHSVYQSYDAIGRLCEVAATSISSACGTTTTPYLNGFAYNVANELTAANYANGVGSAFGFSSDRLQLSSLSYTKSGTTLFGLTYAYGSGLTNDGQIAGITDTVQTGRTATYTYDAMGRLSTAVTVGSTAYPKWGLSFSYDRYGNRTAQSSTAGSPPTNSLSFANPGGAQTNHPDTYTFDAGGIGGNMTYDGYNTLVYDGENRLTSMTSPSASATYTYDSTGLRVQKSVQNGTTTVYVYSGRRVIAEYENGALPANPTREYIYSGAALVAKIEGGATIYYHGDHLSTRLMTDSSGNLFSEQGHYPFGEACYAHNSTTKWEFTTYERDAETDPPPHYGDGNDYAEARENVNRLGRFSSADPVGGSSSDPQALNRYAYVENDPINLTDPSGACPVGSVTINGHMDCSNAHGPEPSLSFLFGGMVRTWMSENGETYLGSAPLYLGISISYSGYSYPFWDLDTSIHHEVPPEVTAPLNLASKVLSGNNDCANFFNSSPLLGATLNEGSVISAADALASDHLEMTPLEPGVSGYTEYQGVGLGSTIQLSQAPTGEFTPDPIGLNVRTSGGVFAGSTLAGQTATILHELAHTLGLIPEDDLRFHPGQSLANSATIDDACAGVILAAIAGLF